MPTPDLRLPQSTHSKVFRACEAVLRYRQSPANADLRRVVRTWRTWEGLAGDDDPPTVAECPWVRLTPDPEPARWEAAGLLQSFLQLRLEIAVAGTRIDDAMDVWAAVHAAFHPGDRAALDALGAAGAFGLEVRQPGYAVVADQEGTMLLGTGLVRLMIHLPALP